MRSGLALRAKEAALAPGRLGPARRRVAEQERKSVKQRVAEIGRDSLDSSAIGAAPPGLPKRPGRAPLPSGSVGDCRAAVGS